MDTAKVVICDLDHKDVNPETRVFEQAGIRFKWFHCSSQEEVIERCSGAEVLLNQYVKMDKKIFDALPSVKCVVRYGVGFDNVNIADADEYGVQVCNVPDYGTCEVADHALSLMMGIVRKTYLSNKLIRQGVWDYRHEIPIFRLSQSVVGICGIGRIGTEFAKRVNALGCNIIAYDTDINKKDHLPDYVKLVSFEELLNKSDIISIHCPLDQSTYHLFDKNAFAEMKKGAYIINAARGGIIDEAALLEALKRGKINGAGLDVVEDEPLKASNELLKFDNFLITPHTAWYSEQASEDLKRKAAEEAARFLTNQSVHYPVNKPRANGI